MRLASVALALWLMPALGLAQVGLPDPTRPPPGVIVDVSSTAGAEVAVDEQEAAMPTLSSVIIPATGKPRAVIDGKMLRLGDMVGEARIVRITETSVVLKGAQGSETLSMTPGVEKKMIRSTQPKARARVENP